MPFAAIWMDLEIATCCWKRVFAMISGFSWQNYVSLWPASFCAPRSNLLVITDIFWLPTFAFQSLMMKRTSFSFLVLVLDGVVGLHKTIQLQLLWHYWLGRDLNYCDVEWFALETNRDHSGIFETASKYCLLGSCWLWGQLCFFQGILARGSK